jgi:hypothetical protein
MLPLYADVAREGFGSNCNMSVTDICMVGFCFKSGLLFIVHGTTVLVNLISYFFPATRDDSIKASYLIAFRVKASIGRIQSVW